MTAFLLDVNVLIALIWPAHEDHTRAQDWFSRKARGGWATCPFTQAALVRIVSNPAFSRDAVTPQEALKLLAANLNHPSHRFWADEISFVAATQSFSRRLTGHGQITDAYLLGLAMHKQGKLATMDRAIVALVPEKSLAESIVEIV